MTPEDVQLYYQIGLMGQRDLPFAPDERSGFEMVLLRMLAFRPDGMDPTRQPGSSTKGGRAKSPLRADQPPVARPAQDHANSVGLEDAAVSSTPASEVKTQVVQGNENDDWHTVVDNLSGSLGGMATQLAENCLVDGWEGDTLKLVLLPEGVALASDRTVNRLSKALTGYYGKLVKIKWVSTTEERPDKQAPAERKARERVDRQRQAEQALRDDPYVQALQNGFDAQIIEQTIKPTDPITKR
jgi:DNA polymerase-3 subunit gamma/tau